MTRGVRLYLVGSFVLVSLAGCGRGFFQSAEREPWRAEAELACLKSGAVKESPELVRIDPISGPGVCGAEYPLKVAALGETSRASALPTKACGHPPISAINRVGRSTAPRRQWRHLREIIRVRIQGILHHLIRRRISRTMPRRRTARSRCQLRASPPRRKTTSICQRAGRHRATVATGRRRPTRRAIGIRRLRLHRIRRHPIRRRRSRRGSGPRRAIRSARSGRSR